MGTKKPKRGRRLLVGALIIVVVLVGLVAAAPFIISTEVVKRQISDQIAYWTGRDFTFRGEPSISLYPYLTVRLSDATLANPEGMGEEPFMDIETMTGKIELLPLLAGRIEFARFRLSNPRINLRTGEDGRGNWILDQGVVGSQISKGDKEGSTDDSAPRSPPADIRLGRFLIRDGIITYTDKHTGRQEELTKVDARFDWTSTTQAAEGEGSFIWRGEPVEFSGAVDTPLDWLAGGSSPLRIALSATPLELAFDGAALQLDGTQLEGDIQLTTPSVRRVVEWMGADVGSGAIFGAGSVSGKVNWLGPSVAITEASVEFDGNVADGAIAVTSVDGHSRVQGTLAFETLDLSPYVDALQIGMTADGPWQSAPTAMPLDAMGALDLRVSTNQLILGDAEIGRTATTIILDDGELSVSVGEMQLEDGFAEARATLQSRGVDLVGSAQLELVDASAAEVLDKIGLAGLRGVVDANLELAGKGRDLREFIGSLSGQATISITEGTFELADLSTLPAAIKDPASLSGSTVFSAAMGTLALAGGFVTTDDFHAEAETLNLMMAGQVGLLTPTIEARGVLGLTEPDDGGGPRDVPFMINGTWDNWRLLPDLGPPIDRSAVAPEDPLPSGG
ncbi:MAG: AsmA family protein [Hyphomicrobiales bacterium]|nr:AsmA family protein [Hyphomicrobiales bacterium]